MINLEKIEWKVPAYLPLLRRPTPTPYFHSFLIFQVPSQFVPPLKKGVIYVPPRNTIFIPCAISCC